MIRNEHFIRVSYSDTDKMGVVHHSNYARYCETGRWELFRELGIPYSKVEEMGFMLPVLTMSFVFVKPAYYDDQVKIVTTFKEFKGVRMIFTYRMYNERQELLSEADTVIAFVEKETFKPCHPPRFILEAIQTYSEKKQEINS